ncbi:hypothetical protein [Allocoleopsis franciscana]|uniref:Uncharacterized protein n=1 Tax=Allocoleopsis franciscana PCC 7113 TaxID=1173027 RepID=K9WQC5_9CYAN|nr:hypothetical protein [Allocoleopsis franciscana]AFZ22383.1 hypothetical protein Mic7113_6826 [Allocoleopsis franciscana PCC 7113]
MNNLESLKLEVSRKLRRNTLASGFFIVTAASLLIPAFSMEGSRFDYTLFCFNPPNLTHPEQHDYCTGEKIRRGITWRVAMEAEQNQQFASKVSILKTIPAQNPYAGLYGLASAGFLGAAFAFFKSATNQLDDHLDAFIWSRRKELYKRALSHELDITLDTQRQHNESEFIKEMMSRDHGQAMLDLMTPGERQLAAERYAKGERLDQAQFDLHLATLQAQAAEQAEKEAKHKSEAAKLNKPAKKKDTGANEPTGDEAAKAELIEKLKEHEGGWLHTLCTTRKILIIEGEQGSFKSYTAALVAYIRYQLKGHKLGWVVDTDYHQNKSKAWSILQPLEFEAYGSNKNGESLRDGLERFLEGIEIRDEDNFAVETLIFDELTTYGDYAECADIAKSFMKFALSAPRKAAYGLIAITHSVTNEGMGKGGGMAKARERGTLHLLLNADNDYNPTFKGTLNGFKNEAGELVEDMPVTLPDWFRPGAIEKMFKGATQ